MVKKKKIPLGHLTVKETDWKIYFIHLGDGVILNTYSLGNFERVCEEPLKVERYSCFPIIAGYQIVPNKSDNCKDYPAKLDMGKYFALKGDENFGEFMRSLRNMGNQEILHEVTLRAVKWDHGLA